MTTVADINKQQTHGKRGEILTSEELGKLIEKDNRKNNNIQNDYPDQEIMPRWAIRQTQTVSCFGRFCTDHD